MNPTNPRRFTPWIILLGALAIPLVYVPSLRTDFDFIDDGNLVYPSPRMPVGERLHVVWDKIVANYEHLGPFRPVLWVHWEAAAELFHGRPELWRLGRLLWSALAVAALLALLRELRLPSAAALFAAALAFWNPYRNEIWTSLTLSEGVAMPYALAALWCAARANRSRRPWPWDLSSALGIVAALGCKNVFAALVPAQLYLRMYADGATWRDGLRIHGRRAALLCLPLLLPIGHYVYFRLHWHPGQYPPSGPTLAQFGRLLRSVLGAESIDFVGPGLVLAGVAIWLVSRKQSVDPQAGAVAAFGESRARSATIVRTGLLLLLGGIAVYLPIPAISGRYTMPAVWGLDLLLAALVAALAALPGLPAKRIAWAALAVGLIVVAGANVGRQEKFAARAAVLWDTLRYVETSATPDDRIAWYSGSALNAEEGIHFHWHLLAHGHDLPVDLFDDHGRPEERCELSKAAGHDGWAVTGSPEAPPGGTWELKKTFRRPYWGGRREYDCYLWSAAG
jgi:hypothetical protein